MAKSYSLMAILADAGVIRLRTSLVAPKVSESMSSDDMANTCSREIVMSLVWVASDAVQKRMRAVQQAQSWPSC